MKRAFELSPEQARLFGTILLIVAFGTLAFFAKENKWAFVFVGCWGALGGIAHELLQSGGKKFLPDPKPKDGLYLGSFGGAMVGAITCLVSSQQWLTFEEDTVVVSSGNYHELGLAVFIVAAAAKGGFEALTGNSVADDDGRLERDEPPVGGQEDVQEAEDRTQTTLVRVHETKFPRRIGHKMQKNRRLIKA